MLRKLKSVVSPMSAMKIDPNDEHQLQSKLHMITQYILNSSKQFETWMELQNNNHLHYCLYQIYQKGNEEEELARIIQFYTLLIINCKDQLLICKLVSDDFIIEMCQLRQLPQHLATQLQAYRINLIKAYMTTITPEIVKYMVVQDKFKVFYICVQLYETKIGSGTVQSTTIANCLLNIMKKVDTIQFLWESIWVPQGLQLLLMQCLSFIYEQVSGCKSPHSSEKKIQIKQTRTKKDKYQINDDEIKDKQENEEFLSIKMEKTVEETKINEGCCDIGQDSQKKQLNNCQLYINLAKQSEINHKEDNKQPALLQTNKENGKLSLQGNNKEIKQEQEKLETDQQKMEQPKKKQQNTSTSLKSPTQISQPSSATQLNKQFTYNQKQSQQQIKQPTNQQLIIKNIQILQQIALFVIELNSSITNPQIKKQINQYCYMDLQEILGVIHNYQQFQSKVYSFSSLFSIFKGYNFQQQAIENIMENWIDKLLSFTTTNGMIKEEDKTDEPKQFQLGKKVSHSSQLNDFSCRAMFIICKVVSSKYSLLSQRWLDQTISLEKQEKIHKIRIQILQMLVKKLETCMDQLQTTQPSYLLNFVKSTLLTAFNLKIAINFSVSKNKKQDQEEETFQNTQLQYRLDQSILQLFLAYTSQFKKLMVHNEHWKNIIKWYEQATVKVTQNLLLLSDTFQKITQDKFYIIMVTYQYIKNYRYMIVQSTTFDPKAIKQEKFYHSTFKSPGMEFIPGTIIKDTVKIVCPCLLHHNYQQTPVVIIEDRQCFLIAIKLSNEQYKLLINIKFRDIDGLLYGSTQTTQIKNPNSLPKFIKINLRGMQQLVLEFNNAKIYGNLFKNYLITNRDSTKQRQLLFLNSWIKNYQIDTEKSLEIVKKYLQKEEYMIP